MTAVSAGAPAPRRCSPSGRERWRASASARRGAARGPDRRHTPGTKEGDTLIAHELTHVVQGGGGGVHRSAEDKGGDGGAEAKQGGGAGELETSKPDEPAEQEADAVSEKIGAELHDDKKGGAKKETGKKGAGDEKGAGDGEGKEDSVKQKPAPIAAKADLGRLFGAWQEFKDLPNDKKAPTTDPSHPHLVELGITNMGPYRYTPRTGAFDYVPPAADLNKLWTDTETTTTYQPEAPPKPQPQATAASLSAPADSCPRVDARDHAADHAERGA